MKGKYLRKMGGLALTALMLFGIAFVSSTEAQAQHRRRRVVIVRPYPYRIYRPFGFRNWWGTRMVTVTIPTLSGTTITCLTTAMRLPVRLTKTV